MEDHSEKKPETLFILHSADIFVIIGCMTLVARERVETKEIVVDPQTVLADGLVNALSTIATRKFTCIFDVARFPFDEHRCIIRVEGWQFESAAYQLSKAVYIVFNIRKFS